jgi:hypothetical protein
MPWRPRRRNFEPDSFNQLKVAEVQISEVDTKPTQSALVHQGLRLVTMATRPLSCDS